LGSYRGEQEGMPVSGIDEAVSDDLAGIIDCFGHS
jgi:hypothetical protein